MAERISDNIAKIVKEVNELKREAREASAETRKLNESLKLDPTNAELTQQRFTSLTRELEKYQSQMITARRYEEQLQKESEVGIKQLSSLKQGTAEYTKLENKLRAADDAMQKFKTASEKAETQVKRLQAAINGINAKKAADEAAQAAKKMQAMQKAMDGLEKASKRLQVAIALIVGVFAKLIKEAIAQGTELYSLSKRYNTSAENIQKWNRALQLATGESDLFTTSLKVMSKGLSTIPVGRGVAYNNALKAIGVSYKELQGLDPTAQFERIIEGLKNVENSSLQSSYAIQLFGESGQSIAQALANDEEAFDGYLEKASKFGIITQESAKHLAELGFELEAVKSQMQVAAAEIAINLAPTILQLANLLNSTLMPILVGLSKMGGALYIIIALILAMKVVSTISKWVIAIKTAEVATRSWTIASVAAKAALLGIIGIIGGIAFRLGSAALAAKQAQSALGDFADTASDLYGGYSSSLGASVEQTYRSSNERTVNISVDIYGEGDTAVSDGAATTIAQLTADEVNRNLGALIKGN